MSVHDIGFIDALYQWQMLGISPEIIFIGIEPEDMSSWGSELSNCLKDKIPKLKALIVNELINKAIIITEKNNYFKLFYINK